VDLVGLAQNRDRRRALFNSVLNLRVEVGWGDVDWLRKGTGGELL
jgi:hypothetical protein